MGWPQIVFIALTAAGLGLTLAKDGQPSQHSFGASLVGNAILLSILYWGGFFG